MAITDHTHTAETTTSDVIMDVQNTSVSFNMDRGTSKVLDDVNININRHEILGVVGESGSGKSMFASALLDAVVKPGVLDGNLTYYPADDEPVNLLKLSGKELNKIRWEEISMVFQGAMSSWNPTMSIRGHFKETLKQHGYNVEEGLEYAHQLLSDLYLNPDRVLGSYPHELSGGMKQRALVALALVLDPDLLVMDEPTAALDLLMQRSILALIKDLQEKYELTVVFITHDLELVAGLADRLAVMYAFNFVEIAPAQELINNPAHPYTRALLRAVPNLETPLSEMRPIDGSSPDPVDVPSGCSYHPRCPLATEQCRSVDPPYHDVSDDHQTACFHWEDAEDAIPISTETADPDEITRIEGRQSTDPVISLDDVAVHFENSEGVISSLFGDPETVYAVDDVNLKVYENDVVALVGESGCGKTTLGKTAISIQPPTDGNVKYRGQDIWDAYNDKRKFWRSDDSEIPYMNIRRSLQIIHQDPGSALNPNRTVEAILADPLKKWNSGMAAEDRHARILSMLETVGMTPPEAYARRYPHQLSGGEKQRVALIRALIMEPDLILADEAVSALDVSLRVEMMDLLLSLQDQFSTSYFFISHNLANARYLAGSVDGRIGVMYLGKIVEIGPAEEIIRNPKHPYTKVLKWSTASLHTEREDSEPPIRGIDIPDSVNPPSGCRFHTRCPEARKTCTQQTPKLENSEQAWGAHSVACFREYGDDHEYWKSEPLEGVESTPAPAEDEDASVD